MNDLDLCLEVVSRSRQPLRYIWRWISRKPSEIEAWFQRTTNRKWHMAIEWSHDRWKVKLVTPIHLERISRKVFELETSNLVCSVVWGMPSGRTNNFPSKWAWPRSRDPYFFGIRSNISSKQHQLQTSNLIHGFGLCMGNAEGWHK